MTRCLAIAALFLASARAAEEPAALELFNGKDLTGWGYKTKDVFQSFDEKTASSESTAKPWANPAGMYSCR